VIWEVILHITIILHLLLLNITIIDSQDRILLNMEIRLVDPLLLDRQIRLHQEVNLHLLRLHWDILTSRILDMDEVILMVNVYLRMPVHCLLHSEIRIQGT